MHLTNFTVTRKDGTVEEYDLSRGSPEGDRYVGVRALSLPATYQGLQALAKQGRMLQLPAQQLLNLLEGYEVIPEDHTQGSYAVTDSLYF